VFKAVGFLIFGAAFVVALKLNQHFLSGIAFAFAIVWLHRSSSMWRPGGPPSPPPTTDQVAAPGSSFHAEMTARKAV